MWLRRCICVAKEAKMAFDVGYIFWAVAVIVGILWAVIYISDQREKRRHPSPPSR